MKANKSPFSKETAEDSSGFLLWQVTNLWQREIKKALEPFGLTHSQFVLLASTQWLTMHNEEVTQVLLSSHTKIDPMTTSTVLRTLQSRGFLQRKEHATDTRAKTVELTPQGRELVIKTVKVVEAFDHAFFSALGSGVSSFNSQLRTLLDNGVQGH